MATDYLLFGDERVKSAVNKINTWLITKTGNNPDNIKSGYQLNGTAIATWDDPAFIAPFTVAAMLDVNNQQWLDDLFAKLLAYDFNNDDYYSNTIKLLNLLVISGNYWSPACDELVAGVKDIEYKNKSVQVVVKKNILKVRSDFQKSNALIIDFKGSVLMSKVLKNKVSEISLSNLPKACYILRLEIENKSVFSQKFVIR